LKTEKSVSEKNQQILYNPINGGDSPCPPRTAPLLSDDGRITCSGAFIFGAATEWNSKKEAFEE
jgi:hypothetical protein